MYARAATPERTAICVDLIAFAKQRGWQDEQIILFSNDNGRPGNTRIDEREGLQTLMTAIQQDIITSILLSDESRLFRDAEARQINTFICLCSEHDVCCDAEGHLRLSQPHLVKLFRFALEADSSALPTRINRGKRNRYFQHK